MELPKVRFVFDEFMEEHGLSDLTKAAFARLLCVSRSSVQKWADEELIPEDYLDALFDLTDEDIARILQPKKWHIYDLRVLRKARDMSQTEMAKELKTCQSSVSEWEENGRIPRNLLPLVQKLEETIPKQQECV